MRVKILILVSILCLISLFGSLCGTGHPVYAAEWTREHIGWEAGWIFLHGLDYGQTRYIAANPQDWKELNPILGPHPTDGQVNLFFLGSAVAHLAMSHFAPDIAEWLGGDPKKDWRRRWQMMSIVIKGGVVGRNMAIGIGVRW